MEQTSATALEVFSPEWTTALGAAIDVDAGYRDLARDWKGVLGLRATDLAGGRTAILDLQEGRCRNTSNDVEAYPPEYVLEAELATWKKVLEGTIDPIWGLMSGQIRLGSGALADLLPQAQAAQRIVACARDLPAVFPEVAEP